ncbi:MAG: hypothetical protein SFY96_12575 [Planctomycetota bacterium]|nr:hypothetical protein [Planctomycetota bacterium]
MKKVNFAAKPAARSGQSFDQWVAGKPQAEPTKRLTIDVPLSLHRRMKTRCVLDDVIMADVIRDLLMQRFPEEPSDQSHPSLSDAIRDSET